jgi:predicted Fe-Mo cluster-binding NifX family protein
MQITTPIPGLDNFMVVETSDGDHKRVMYAESSKFNTLSKPGGAEAKLFQSLNVDFIVRGKTPEDALQLIFNVWGYPEADAATEG